VLTEVADGLCEPRNRPLAAQLRQLVRSSPFIRVVPADEELFQAGFDFFEARTDKEWSLTDCISFVVMERERLSDALTGDHHFEQAGFKALMKD
jgi:predicted nucleic acid-binding protein